MKNFKIKKYPLLSKLSQILIFTVFVMFFSTESKAQVAVHASANYNNIRSAISLANKEPRLGFSFGLSLQYYPLKKFNKVSLINEINYSLKGYQQNFDRKYDFRFTYLAFPILINYDLSDNVSVYTGVELSELITTNIEQGKETYNNFDLGLVLGLSFLTKSRISFYSRLTYGITPMIDYYEIDELGNFNREIHDLKNICLSIGFKFKIQNEKIRLYK